MLETIEIGPKENAARTIIWMHGLGADGHDFEPIAPELGLPADTRFIFPHAPQRPITINGGMVMRAWYDIVELGGARQDESGFRDSDRLIGEVIEREVERGVPLEKIVLAGFSQGGAMALFSGLRYPKKLAGLIVLSAYLPLHEKIGAEINRENLDIPIFMAHGSQDPMVPMALGKLSSEQLTQWGARPEWHDYPIPHSVCAEEIRDIATFLKRVF